MLICWFNHEKLFLYGGMREVFTRSVAHFMLFPYLLLAFQIWYPQLIKLQKCVELKCRIKFSNLLLQLDSKVTTSWISHSIVRTASVSSELLPILWFVSQYLWGYDSTNCFHVTLSCRIAVSWNKAERNNVFLEQ